MNIDLSSINKTEVEPNVMLKGYSYGCSPNCKPQGRHKVMNDCGACNRYGECDCNDCHWEDCKNKVMNCGACNRYGECDCSDCTYDGDHCDCDYDCHCDCDCGDW